MPTGVTVRLAAPGDREAILTIVQHAFAHDGRDGQEELDIVRDTWALDASPDQLELVAVEDGVVLGHVLGSRGDLDGREVLGVAPLAVTPPRQGEGIGSALMGELVDRAERAGWPLVVLLGSPGYYGRFGFEPAGPLGITYRPVGTDDPHFQVRRLAGYDPSYRGDFTYCWELPSR